MIAEQGCIRAPPARIADVTGTSSSAVLSHFGSKDAVLASVYSTVSNGPVESVSTAHDAHDKPRWPR